MQIRMRISRPIGAERRRREIQDSLVADFYAEMFFTPSTDRAALQREAFFLLQATISPKNIREETLFLDGLTGDRLNAALETAIARGELLRVTAGVS